MDPRGPSQPNTDTAYNTVGNPADQTEKEQASSAANAASNPGPAVDQRKQGDTPVPSTHNEEATPTALGYGARDSSGDNEGDVRYYTFHFPLLLPYLASYYIAILSEQITSIAVRLAE